MIMRRTPYAYFMLILNYQIYFSTKCFNLARLFEVNLLHGLCMGQNFQVRRVVPGQV
jgi:hypothetical protein